MEAAAEWYLALPLLLTGLAVLLATLFLRLRPPQGDKAAEELGAAGGEKEQQEQQEEQDREDKEEEEEEAAGRAAEAEKQSPPPELSAPLQAGEEEEEEEEDSKEEEQEWENERLVVNEPDVDDAADEQISFKYSPGKLRGNQYKTMMTKEELEEEQRTEDYMKLSLDSS